jgi:antitoxin VapB
VNSATTYGEAALLISTSGRYLITNNIEATRLEQEEKLPSQGWETRIAPWHERRDAVGELTRGMRLGADGLYPGAKDLTAEVARLRVDLTPEEGERFRTLGGLCAQAMHAAVRSVQPGNTEHEIAAHLALESESRGVQAIVNLVATDERVHQFRHPLPTGKALQHYAMLVLCGRKWGLVSSVTRLVHFGRLEDELKRKEESVARIDAVMIAATRPGRALKEVFGKAVSAYAECGFPEEWRCHHQGGPAGYEPREYLATPTSTETIRAGQTYAWNPSIRGTKSEDTILIGEAGNEIVTAIRGWPTTRIETEGQAIERPRILQIV